MKNLILVIGRSGSGKDTLIRHAKEVFNDVYKIVSVPSYTDRPMRPTETDGVEHTFLTKDMFDEVLAKENVFAYTKIGDTGFRYCSTVEMLNRLDGDTIFYTIDPNGYDFCSKFKWRHHHVGQAQCRRGRTVQLLRGQETLGCGYYERRRACGSRERICICREQAANWR